ncbi:MAG: hypothetical protein ACD_39C02088G0003 [uncultured bacterium]|nr:MAG: hypothetical protein ACD_39C02088G0003 [uncultured bacterium]
MGIQVAASCECCQSILGICKILRGFYVADNVSDSFFGFVSAVSSTFECLFFGAVSFFAGQISSLGNSFGIIAQTIVKISLIKSKG